MSLLVDSDVVTTADMIALDSEVAEIASAENITLAGDGGIIGQAWDECADTLLAHLQQFGGGQYTPVSPLCFSTSVNRPRVALHQICVSPQQGRRTSPIHRWMIYRSLALFYRACINRPSGQDRYEARLDRAVADEAEAWRRLYQYGIPIVSEPLPCPGALHEVDAGEFTSANLSTVSGGSLVVDTSYDVAITWVDYVLAQNGESGPSDVVTITIPASEKLVVGITGLVPPGSASQRGTAETVNFRLSATGWNVYAGLAGGTLYKQNDSPVSVDTTSYTLSGDPALSGTAINSGQYPDRNETLRAILQRG